MVDFNAILDAARQLSDSDRIRLIEALRKSVPDDIDLPLDDVWAKELEHRVAKLKSGSPTVSWSQIRAEALARIDDGD